MDRAPEIPGARARRSWLGAALLLALVGAPALAFAQDAPEASEPIAAEEWMDRQIAAVEETLRQARFRSALGISDQLRQHPAATSAQRIRLELAHATAAIALDDDPATRESLLRVLALDPGFAFGADRSPKLRRALVRARQGSP